MTWRRSCISAAVALLAVLASSAWAQDLGPNVRKIKDGIYVQSAREVNSNGGNLSYRQPA